jgi:phage terminase large subunit
VYAINARKDVLAGLQRVKSRLVVQGDGYPRLFVSSRCVNVIKEFELYRWQDSKDDRNDKEEPLKQNDHAMDALRYMVMQMDAPSGVAQVSAASLGL